MELSVVSHVPGRVTPGTEDNTRDNVKLERQYSKMNPCILNRQLGLGDLLVQTPMG